VLRQISLTRLAVETSRSYHDIFTISSSLLTLQELLLTALVSKHSRMTRFKSAEQRKNGYVHRTPRRRRESVRQQTTVWRRIFPTVYSLRQCNTGKFTGTTDTRRPTFFSVERSFANPHRSPQKNTSEYLWLRVKGTGIRCRGLARVECVCACFSVRAFFPMRTGGTLPTVRGLRAVSQNRKRFS